MKWHQVPVIACVVVILLTAAPLLAQQPPAQAAGGAEDSVAALKQSMQQGLAKDPAVPNGLRRPSSA